MDALANPSSSPIRYCELNQRLSIIEAAAMQSWGNYSAQACTLCTTLAINSDEGLTDVSGGRGSNPYRASLRREQSFSQPPGTPLIKNLRTPPTGTETLPTNTMVITSERCVGSPALVNQNDKRLVVAWSGQLRGENFNFASLLNVMFSTDGVTWDSNTKYTFLDETTRRPPGLAYDPETNTTYIAWTGTDPSWSLNIRQSTAPDLDKWVNKHTLTEYSYDGPALAFGSGLLFVAWTGTNLRLYVASTRDGGKSWITRPPPLDETSYSSPCLIYNNGELVLGWQGTDNQLNFLTCNNLNTLSFPPSTKLTIPQTSESQPGLAFDVDERPWLSWRGLKNDNLNQIIPSNGKISGFRDTKQVVFDDTSFNGPVLCRFQKEIFISWEGTDPDSHLNVSVFLPGKIANNLKNRKMQSKL
jgi:hypothetical protein